MLFKFRKRKKNVIREVQETSNSSTRLELKGKLIKELELKRKKHLKEGRKRDLKRAGSKERGSRALVKEPQSHKTN